MKENVAEIKGKAEKFADEVEKTSKKEDARKWWGLFIVAIGLLIFFDNFGFFRVFKELFNFNVWNLWPLLLVGLGIWILTKKEN